MKNTVDGAFADIDVQMKKRFDLVENLVNTVKGYATHEKETLSQVIAARSGYNNATTTEEKVQAANMLTNTLKTLFAVSEAYPDFAKKSIAVEASFMPFKGAYLLLTSKKLK